MKKVLLYLWQLPQHLLGLLVILFYNASYLKHQETGIGYWFGDGQKTFGVSLGQYIILDNCTVCVRILKHEHGHQLQSLYLGPLYLLIIGLPSAIGNLLNRKIKFNYYKQPWEAWADKLGGVTR